MNKMKKKLKDSNCDLKSKGKQRTISPPDLQKSLRIISCSNFHIPVGEQGATDVEFNAWRTEALELNFVFYGFDNEIRL